MKTCAKIKTKGNEGSIVLDFLFGLVLSFGCITVFIALAYSLATVEVVQYMTYSAARKYSGAHKCVSATGCTGANPSQIQESRGKTKFVCLQGTATSCQQTPSFAVLFSADWFEIGPTPVVVGSKVKMYKPNVFEFAFGVQAPLQIKLLELNIPFFGSTNTISPGNGFQTTVTSYLIPEPSEQDCLNFNDNRANLIKALPKASASTSTGYGSVGVDPATATVRISDNGC